MLDLKFIRDYPDAVKDAVTKKGLDVDVDRILHLDALRRDLIVKIDTLRAERNSVSAEIPSIKDAAEKQTKIEAMRHVGDQLKTLEAELAPTEEELNALMLITPNIPSEDSPIGGEEANKEGAKVGEPRTFGFEPKSYLDLLTERGMLDLERGAKTSGYRGYYLKGDLAHLHLALMTYALRKLDAKGFTPMVPPILVRGFALTGSGHFPFGKEEIYQIGNPGKLADGTTLKEPLYLGGTSEPSLLAYFADEILEEADLPVRVCGVSPCFRSEIGSYGKDAKGLYRVHEFWKVEQVIICRAEIEESDKLLEDLRKVAEEILTDLELPYRVLQLATGDMGAGKRKMYDLEAWMPSRNSYGETHSDSNLTDWQTRRLNIRYRTTNGDIRHAYALNNTALASPRILIALVENHQQADGSIKIPAALQPFVGKEKI